jgi:hypothetical protein
MAFMISTISQNPLLYQNLLKTPEFYPRIPQKINDFSSFYKKKTILQFHFVKPFPEHE